MLTTIREEQLLAKFAGEDVAVPQPCTRTEKFLAKMAGLDVQTPTPITREEQILNKIAEGGGGGGGGGDFSTAEVTFKSNMSAEVTRPRISGLATIETPPFPGAEGQIVANTFNVPNIEISKTIVLYKGEVLSGMIEVVTGNITNVIVSGGVTVEDNAYLEITGNGTCEIIVEET